MGQLTEERSSMKMNKKGSPAAGGAAPGRGKAVLPKESLDLCDPKIQGIMLVGLLAVLALALWFGFTRGCLSCRRRRRRSSC